MTHGASKDYAYQGYAQTPIRTSHISIGTNSQDPYTRSQVKKYMSREIAQDYQSTLNDERRQNYSSDYSIISPKGKQSLDTVSLETQDL